MRAQSSVMLLVYVACSLSLLAMSVWLCEGVSSASSRGYSALAALYSKAGSSLQGLASLLR